MYPEIQKYSTGKQVLVSPNGMIINESFYDVDSNLKISAKDTATFKVRVDDAVYLDEYSVLIGTLIYDLIKHEKKPFWKRKFSHNHVKEIMIDALNKIKLTWNM